MAHLLFPGRHVLNTRFQEEYLLSVQSRPIAQLSLWGRGVPSEPLTEVISAYEAFDRRQPGWIKVALKAVA